MASKLTNIPTINAKVSTADRMRMVYVPEGEFIMGSTEDDPNACENEKPQRKIHLEAYWIDQTPVTNAMYARFLNKMGINEKAEEWLNTLTGYQRIFKINGVWQVSKTYTGFEDHPIVCVTWYGAQAYARWARRRLPTEAQWEKAARGTDGKNYPWGNDEPNTNRIDYYQESYAFTGSVGSYPDGASPYGAVDMVGCVRQWVADVYDEKFYASMPSKNPFNSHESDHRVVRGGFWRDGKGDVRSAVRSSGNLVEKDKCGFRCALPA